MKRILDEFGVRTDAVSSFLLNSYEKTLMDPNDDSIVVGSEMNADMNKDLALVEEQRDEVTMHKVVSEFYRLRIKELQRLDANLDGEIGFEEFSAWVGNDPDIMFDVYDLDKSGYLDEEEITRFLIDKQVPRFAVSMINLDPDFDGRIYFSKYKDWVSRAPQFMFEKYDLDDTGDLDEGELADLTVDLGINLDGVALSEIIDPNTRTVSLEAYGKWFRREPGQIREFRDVLKADNAPHRTMPDRLTGPLHTVEARRAKYIAISSLTPDFLSTNGLVKELEGELDNAMELIAMMEADGLLFNSDDEYMSDGSSVDGSLPFRRSISPDDIRHQAKYWNGREAEGRPSAPPHFQYALECENIAGDTEGCQQCLNHSPHVTEQQELFRSDVASFEHCQNDKTMDAYVKAFDQEVNMPLRHQQNPRVGTFGIGQAYTPCINEDEVFPCDVWKDWEQNQNNEGLSVKVN